MMNMRQSLPPVSAAIIALNVLVYMANVSLGDGPFLPFALWPPGLESIGGEPFEPWQLITYAFLHGSPTHLFFNMFALFMFGFEIERLLGAVRYIVYYFTCVLGAAVAQLLVFHFSHGPSGPVIGASGGVFGVLLACGMAFPHRRVVLLFPPIPMPMWVFVTLYGVLELILGVTGTQQGVAHFAHLGGMAAGFILIQLWRSRARSGY